MKLAEDIWLGSVAAQNNLMAAASYSTAFYGNAAVQSWSLGLTAPQVFWSAMARAFNATPDNRDVTPATDMPAANAPAIRIVEDASPVVDPVPEVAEDQEPLEAEATEAAQAPDATVETEAEVGDSPNLLLLDKPRGGAADDLKLIKGIGTKLEAALNDVGIYHYDQLAGLDEAGIDRLDDLIPGFKRSCARFDLVGGARLFS